MQTRTMPTTLYDRLKAMGLSKPYASQLARGQRRPGLVLAIRIWRETGAKLGPLALMTRHEIERLERIKLKTWPVGRIP